MRARIRVDPVTRSCTGQSVADQGVPLRWDSMKNGGSLHPGHQNCITGQTRKGIFGSENGKWAVSRLMTTTGTTSPEWRLRDYSIPSPINVAGDFVYDRDIEHYLRSAAADDKFDISVLTVLECHRRLTVPALSRH